MGTLRAATDEFLGGIFAVEDQVRGEGKGLGHCVALGLPGCGCLVPFRDGDKSQISLP